MKQVIKYLKISKALHRKDWVIVLCYKQLTLPILVNTAIYSDMYDTKQYVQNVGGELELSWAGNEGWLLSWYMKMLGVSILVSERYISKATDMGVSWDLRLD